VTYSAHMVQHVVLAQLGPLALALVVSRPRRRVAAPLAWILGVGTMVVTSLPPAYLLATSSATVDWTIRFVLVGAGFVFWTPVVGGVEQSRLPPGAALLYVITACFATTLTGAYIAFSAMSSDQQIAGLIMWVPCCIVYLSAALVVVMRAMELLGPSRSRVCRPVGGDYGDDLDRSLCTKPQSQLG
jgi:putative membrane protein